MIVMNNAAKPISNETLTFVEKFLASFHYVKTNGKQTNDKSVNSAMIYEKFRNALEYQEDHLIFKNAVSRIIRRQYTLVPGITAPELLSDLLNELTWANYLNPDDLKPDTTQKVQGILERYLVILRAARSGYLPKHEVNKTIINWLACELDEVLKPVCDQDILIDFAYSVLAENVETKGTRISEVDNEIQLKLAIFSTVFKPDNSLIEYWLLKKLYPGWLDYPLSKAKEFGSSFDPYYNKIRRITNHPARPRYYIYVKRNIAPFILMRDLPAAKGVNAGKVKENPHLLRNSLLEVYDSVTFATRIKVWRGTMRALVFILLTKISLALFLEVPFDHYLTGTINYLSLCINILLPPFLMLIAGTFVKSPSPKNRETVGKAIDAIATEGIISKGKFQIARKPATTVDNLFNIVYWVISLAILAGVVWALLSLEFNFLSILLFFFFVSAVSFFSFRIRNIALELAMVRVNNDSITSTVEFVFSPFIRIGKVISDRVSRSNPFIIALDFLIEAPFKTILKILNSWFKFVNAKKEEIDL